MRTHCSTEIFVAVAVETWRRPWDDSSAVMSPAELSFWHAISHRLAPAGSLAMA